MNSNIEILIRRDLKNMRPYIPIEPTDILSQRLDINASDIIKLDGNENPYGCSDKVRLALSNYSNFNLYPDPEQRELRKELAKYIGVEAKYIIAGSGSDEIIDLILRLFIEPGDKVINCPPTFGMYRFSTEVCGGKVVEVPRLDDFSIDLNLFEGLIDERTKIIFIASPNNPSGNLIPEQDILKLLSFGTIVVVDEAYAEFSGKTVVTKVPEFPNLIVLRTFSKWAGLAGLRVGYGIVPNNIWGYLMKIKQPYNVNIAAQLAAIESLKDVKCLQETIQLLLKERERLSSKLKAIEWLKVYPSQANFILCSVLNGKAKVIYNELKRKGIFIRYFDSAGLQNCIRISVGTPEHTDRIIDALGNI
jgi:histidinol-phosphate aminotransferase